MEEKDLIKIEAQLLEQEHRPFSLLQNFFGRKQWDKEDPRRRAVKSALVYRLFFSPAVIAGTGGIIALASLFILYWQTDVLIDQNKLLQKQNQKIDNQTYLIEAQRRSSLQFEISEILNRIDDELQKEKVNRRLSSQLKSRIIAATVSMKPYRSYENDRLSRPYSYEKGQFFAAIMNSGISNSDLSDILEKGNFSYMFLENITIGVEGKSFDLKSFSAPHSIFKNVIFYGLNVFGKTDFSNSDFDACKFLRMTKMNFNMINTFAHNSVFEINVDPDILVDYLSTTEWEKINSFSIDLNHSKFEYCYFTYYYNFETRVEIERINQKKTNELSLKVILKGKGSSIKKSVVRGLKMYSENHNMEILSEGDDGPNSQQLTTIMENVLEVNNLVLFDSPASKTDFLGVDCLETKNLFVSKLEKIPNDQKCFKLFTGNSFEIFKALPRSKGAWDKDLLFRGDLGDVDYYLYNQN